MRRMGRRVRQLCRWFRLGRGPLVRSTDRAERVARLFLLLAILSAAPVGVLTGRAVLRSEADAAAQQARLLHQVQATALTDPRIRNPSAPDAVEVTTAAWTGSDGAQTAEVMVGPAVTKGARISVWLTEDGHVTEPPRTASGVQADAVSAGALAGLGTGGASWLLFGLARGILDARRLRRWETDWLEVEPLWSSGTR